MWRLYLIIDNLLAYVCDWSLGAHKIMHPILSLKLGVTKVKKNEGKMTITN